MTPIGTKCRYYAWLVPIADLTRIYLNQSKTDFSQLPTTLYLFYLTV